MADKKVSELLPEWEVTTENGVGQRRVHRVRAASQFEAEKLVNLEAPVTKKAETVLDTRPPGRLADPAGAFDRVEGRRVAGAAP